jgi:hypothetical protein
MEKAYKKHAGKMKFTQNFIWKISWKQTSWELKAGLSYGYRLYVDINESSGNQWEISLTAE